MGKVECGISSAKRSIAEWLQLDRVQFVQVRKHLIFLLICDRIVTSFIRREIWIY
jgi:hypothetical protein